jgi:hypothetical protein
MSAFLLGFLLILSCGLHAQGDIAFKIITATPGASINGEPATAGFNVEESDNQLIIPNGGHVGLITSDGNLYKLTTSMSVSKVNEFVQRQLSKQAKEYASAFATRTVCVFPGELALPLAPETALSSETLEDSVFLFWVATKPGDYFSPKDIPKVRSAGKSFDVRFTTMFEDPLQTVKVDKNWLVTKYPVVEKATIYRVSCTSPEGGSGFYLIKSASDEKAEDIRKQLLQFSDKGDQEYLRCAVLDLNGLKLDKNMSLFRIISRGLTTVDPILKKYLANQIAENNLGLMDGGR